MRRRVGLASLFLLAVFGRGLPAQGDQPGNPRANRLLLAPTALQLPRGNVAYTNVWLIFHNLDVGLSDRVQLGMGLTFFPGLGFAEVFWVQPQVVVVRTRRASLAAGAAFGGELHPGNAEPSDPGRGAWVYGIGTWGSRNSNMSLGLAWSHDGRLVSRVPLVMLGGQLRLTSQVAVLSENWIAPAPHLFMPPYRRREVTMLQGIRLLGSRWSADVALMTLRDRTGTGLWLGLSYSR